MLKDHKTILLLYILLFTFLSLGMGELFEAYYRWWWWDIMLHTKFGFSCALVGSYFALKNEGSGILFKLLFVISLTMHLAVLWEFFEWFVDLKYGTQMQDNSLQDTMQDLLVCFLGSLVGVVAMLRLHYGSERGYFLKKLKGLSK